MGDGQIFYNQKSFEFYYISFLRYALFKVVTGFRGKVVVSGQRAYNSGHVK